MSEIIRDESEIDEIINETHIIENEEGSRYPGMSYEQGLRDMYEWLIGDSDDNPLEL